MSVTYRSWYPASVLLPDKKAVHRVRAYATSEGLLIYTKPSEEPHWSSPIDWTATTEPRRGVLHVGLDIHTDAGLVVVTPTGGCVSCSSTMRGWHPAHLETTASWPTRTES